MASVVCRSVNGASGRGLGLRLNAGPRSPCRPCRHHRRRLYASVSARLQSRPHTWTFRWAMCILESTPTGHDVSVGSVETLRGPQLAIMRSGTQLTEHISRMQPSWKSHECQSVHASATQRSHRFIGPRTRDDVHSVWKNICLLCTWSRAMIRIRKPIR